MADIPFHEQNFGGSDKHQTSDILTSDIQLYFWLLLNMKTSPFYKIIYFDEFSATPKYQQLANSIVKGIEEGKLQVNDVLPSINELSFEFEICRDTAEKGYKYLKKQGIIGSVPGKGYFIKNVDVNRTIRIFLM